MSKDLAQSYAADFRSRRSNVLSTRGMVATSQPLAAQAGLSILQAGGNAADAAVAVAAMLNVVEPTSTGIGGDCFALFWDNREKTVTALNGSGRAAAAASIEELSSLGYRHMPRFTGHSVSVPGAVAGWSDLLERHGRLSLADVLKPAIWTAENGYPVTEWIARTWHAEVPKLLRLPDWKSGDLDNGPPQESGQELLLAGRAPQPGELIRLPDLARTLRHIAAEGKDYIYRGEFAERLAQHVQHYGGWLTSLDMAAHTSTWEEPLSADYRGVTLYECPPNSQGLAAVLAANLAVGFELGDMPEPDRVHIMVECMRLALADAAGWVADPSAVQLPVAELCSKAYADQRRRLIDPARARDVVVAGDPRQGTDTAYLSVVDGDGNACSFISSLYMATGTGLVVPGTGVSLQNRASLFSLDASHPNSLAPNKRPYHTIIPALTTRGGELHACFGVMGGFMQPQGHFQLLVNLVDLGMWPQRALDAPRWHVLMEGEGLKGRNSDCTLLVEPGWHRDTLTALSRRGHMLQRVSGFRRIVFGGGQVIARNPQTGVLTAGSDPRKDGCAVGW